MKFCFFSRNMNIFPTDLDPRQIKSSNLTSAPLVGKLEEGQININLMAECRHFLHPTDGRLQVLHLNISKSHVCADLRIGDFGKHIGR